MKQYGVSDAITFWKKIQKENSSDCRVGVSEEKKREMVVLEAMATSTLAAMEMYCRSDTRFCTKAPTPEQARALKAANVLYDARWMTRGGDAGTVSFYVKKPEWHNGCWVGDCVATSYRMRCSGLASLVDDEPVDIVQLLRDWYEAGHGG
jgi:hypothetical protein